MAERCFAKSDFCLFRALLVPKRKEPDQISFKIIKVLAKFSQNMPIMIGVIIEIFFLEKRLKRAQIDPPLLLLFIAQKDNFKKFLSVSFFFLFA